MSLSFSRVKTYKPIKGLRGGIVDITLDALYADDGWSITAANLTNVFGIGARIYGLKVLGSSDTSYRFKALPVTGNASIKLQAWRKQVQSAYLGALAEFVMYPAGSGTEQAAALAKVYDASALEYQNLATSATGAGYTANYQLFPDSPADNDALYLGGALPFTYIEIDMSATVSVYDEAAVLAWQYYNGTTWATLQNIYDGTGSTGTTGAYFGEQDGKFIFPAPNDWASISIGGQAGYWIRGVVQTDKGDNMTTVGLTNSKEHLIWAPTTGIVAPWSGFVTGLALDDRATTLHTANDIVFVLQNFTTGKSAGSLITFDQDLGEQSWNLVNSISVSKNDKLGIALTQEDGTNEATATLRLDYEAQADASEADLSGVVVRAEVIGS